MITNIDVLNGLIEAHRLYCEKVTVSVEHSVDKKSIINADIVKGKIADVQYGEHIGEKRRAERQSKLMGD